MLMIGLLYGCYMAIKKTYVDSKVLTIIITITIMT